MVRILGLTFGSRHGLMMKRGYDMNNADRGNAEAGRRNAAENIYCQPCGKTTRHEVDRDGTCHCPLCLRRKVPGPQMAMAMLQRHAYAKNAVNRPQSMF
jgi:ferredoxin-thioredoxin reductase catalytic subunit